MGFAWYTHSNIHQTKITLDISRYFMRLILAERINLFFSVLMVLIRMVYALQTIFIGQTQGLPLHRASQSHFHHFFPVLIEIYYTERL